MIIICDYCKKIACPSSCPGFSGHSPELRGQVGECYECSSYVYEGDSHVLYGGRLLCRECAEELVPPELLSFLKCKDVKDFFDMLF